MISKIRDMILRTDSCIGVGITLLPEDKWQVTAVILKLQKNRIVKERDFQPVSSLEELFTKTGGKLPVAAVVNGKGVLHKKLPLESLPDNPLEAIIPNANAQDFYCSVSSSGDRAYVSVVRKEVLEKITTAFRKAGFSLLDVSTGITVIPWLLPFLNLEKGQPLFVPPFTLRFNQGNEVFDVENVIPEVTDTARIEYNLGDQYVYADALLAFGAGTAHIASDLRDPPALSLQGIIKNREEHIYRRYYRCALLTLLAGVFCILLVNFLVYNHYFSKNKAWQDSQLVSQEAQGRIRQSMKTLHAREQFLLRAGWLPSPRISFFADRIAGMVPSGTLLTGMKIYPAGMRQAGEDGIRFRQDTIQVTGVCEDPTELNQFTNNLKNIQNFREVSVRNYLYKKDAGTGAFLMEIILK